MYDDGLIYRGKRLINWCPRCQTALSDLEVDHEEEQGFLWHVRYPLVDGTALARRGTGEYITVATTRPETIVADIAIAVQPGGRALREPASAERAILPIIRRVIPIVGDEAIEMEFGTGALKVTPGHDPIDFEIGQRHGLPIINAINLDGTMNDEAGPYAGMDRFDAREAIVRDLEEQGFLEKTEPYTHSVGHCDRCDTVVEPLMSEQWFVQTDRSRSLAAAASRPCTTAGSTFVPERFDHDLPELDGEHPRLVHLAASSGGATASRSGTARDEDGDRIIVTLPDRRRQARRNRASRTYNELRARRRLARARSCGTARGPLSMRRRSSSIETPERSPTGGGNLLQESDMLDTWFSSGLWPFSTLGWPDDNDDLRYFYPTSVMETGYDIIFLWVARMIMLGLFAWTTSRSASSTSTARCATTRASA